MNVQITPRSARSRVTNPRRTGVDRVRLVDVARAAGVSRQTVSNAVNRPERVDSATLERVHREIARLDFRPNVAARSLRRRRAQAVGVQVNSVDDRPLGHVLDEFLVQLTVAAREYDAHLVAFSVHDEEDPLRQYEQLVGRQVVDGFVLTDTRHDDPRPGWLREHAIPFVSFGRVWDDPACTSWVDVDGHAGVREAVHALIAAGYQRVGFLGWPPGSPVGDDRRAGWLAGLADHGLPVNALHAQARQDAAAAQDAVAALRPDLRTGDALVCASDILATGALLTLRESGLTPGRDVGLVGFDNSEFAYAFGLSSVSQPLRQVAVDALAMLRSMQDGQHASEGVILRPALVARGSSNREDGTPTVERGTDFRTLQGKDKT